MRDLKVPGKIRRGHGIPDNVSRIANDSPGSLGADGAQILEDCVRSSPVHVDRREQSPREGGDISATGTNILERVQELLVRPRGLIRKLIAPENREPAIGVKLG